MDEGKKLVETMLSLDYISPEDLEHRNAADTLKKAIIDLKIGLIIIRKNTPNLLEIETLLREGGFKSEDHDKYIFWYSQ